MPGRRLQFAVRRFLDNGGIVIPWNQWAGGALPEALELPPILGGKWLRRHWQADDHVSVIDHLVNLAAAPTTLWDANILEEWQTSPYRYGFNNSSVPGESPLLTTKDSGGRTIKVIPGLKANILTTNAQPWRAGWVDNPAVPNYTEPRAYHVQQMMQNTFDRTGITPTVLNLELEGLLSGSTDWWSKSNWYTRDADLAEGRSRISKFLWDVKNRTQSGVSPGWVPQTALSEVWMWPGFWAPRHGPAILTMLFNAVSDAGLTPRFFNWVPVSVKEYYSQMNWNAEREMRAAFPPGTMIPCVWMWDRQRNPSPFDVGARFWTWQIEAAFETVLAWNPDATSIVIDTPGTEYSNAIRAVSTYLNRVRAL